MGLCLFDQGERKVTHSDSRVRLGTAADVLEEVQIALSKRNLLLHHDNWPALYLDPNDRR